MIRSALFKEGGDLAAASSPVVGNSVSETRARVVSGPGSSRPNAELPCPRHLIARRAPRLHCHRGIAFARVRTGWRAAVVAAAPAGAPAAGGGDCCGGAGGAVGDWCRGTDTGVRGSVAGDRHSSVARH